MQLSVFVIRFEQFSVDATMPTAYETGKHRTIATRTLAAATEDGVKLAAR